MTNRVGHVADQGTLLGPHFTALNTEAAIDAVRTVRVRTGGDGYRATRADTDTEFGTSFNQHIAYAAHRVRPIGVAVWVAPGIIGGSGDGNFFLKPYYDLLEKEIPVAGPAYYPWGYPHCYTYGPHPMGGVGGVLIKGCTTLGSRARVDTP